MDTTGPKTVLVVEDDEDLVYLITILLEEQGYCVITAANGREALEALQAGLPDLILLDMKMPVMSGPEFARELSAQHRHLPPIVVVTAADDAQRRASEIHADGWLGKPFD